MLVLVLASPVYAQSQDDEEEDDNYVGCAMLRAGISGGMYVGGTSAGVQPWLAGAAAALAFGGGYYAEAYCSHVTEETVEAYENAMNTLGIQILWHTYHDPSMGWCLSIRQYDCIPYIDPDNGYTEQQLLFVEQSWETVRSSSEFLLLQGTDNTALISPALLASSLAHGFAESGLQSGYAQQHSGPDEMH
jgi:hypothetical protein